MRAQRKATAEYRLTVAGLALAVATLIVVLGVDGGFADRVETARLTAGDDTVRIISLAEPKVVEGVLRVHPLDIYDYNAVLEGVTMGQEVALFSGFSMLHALPPGHYVMHEGDERLQPEWSPNLDVVLDISKNVGAVSQDEFPGDQRWAEVQELRRKEGLLVEVGYIGSCTIGHALLIFLPIPLSWRPREDEKDGGKRNGAL